MTTESAAVEFEHGRTSSSLASIVKFSDRNRVKETGCDDQVPETRPAKRLKRPERKTLLGKFLEDLDLKLQQQPGLSHEEFAWLERFVDWSDSVEQKHGFCNDIPRYPGGPPPNLPSFGGDPAVQARIKAEGYLKGYVRTAEMAIEFFNKNNPDADYEAVEVISGSTFFHVVCWDHINFKAKPKGASADDDQSVKLFFAEWYADDSDFDGRICQMSEGQIAVCCLLEGLTKDCTAGCFGRSRVEHPLRGFIAGPLDGFFDGSGQ